MSVLDKAKEHFASLERRSLDVPEWDCTIFWTPWTVGERQKLWGQIKASGREAEINARAIILKAQDADGKPVFRIDDLKALTTSVDASVVERVGGEIIGVDASAADVEKN